MLTAILLLTLTAFCAVESSTRVVCYYTNWSQYRNGNAKFVPENVDPYMCTHVMYAFAKPVGTSIKAFEWNDDSTAWSKGMYERMMDLKKKNPNLKVLLAIGGYNLGSGPFSTIVRSPSSRSAFAQSAISFLRQRNFDGLDVDWEYPTDRGSPPQDKQNFLFFMQELMRAFQNEARTSGKPRLLLTGAFPAGKSKIDNGYDLVPLSQSMDFINVMSYDLHGSWEKETGINSPLFAHQQDTGDKAYLNVDWVAQYYVAKGVPKDKIVVGLSTYGRAFTLDSTARTGVYAPASKAGQAGTYTQENGFLAYYEICELLQTGGRSFDVPSQRSRYLVKGNLWVGYDDVQTTTEKACYVKENGFGGIMFWALDLDDFTGSTCGEGRYPLMTAAIREMNQPSLANCVRRTTNGNANVGQPGVVTYRPRPTYQPSGVITYRPTPFPPVVATQRPTYQPTATLRPYVQPPNTNTNPNNNNNNGKRPTGYIPINPPTNGPATNAPLTYAPLTNAPVTFPPVTNAPVTNRPVTYGPLPVTPAQTTRNPYSFTLPTYGVNTPKPPAGVTFLPGIPTSAPAVTSAPSLTSAPAAPIVTNAPAGTRPKTTPASTNFDCTTKISDFYADPASCDHFYICANKVTYRVPCALGLKYNTASKYCDWSYNVQCQGRPSAPATGGFPSSNPNPARPTPAPTVAPTPAPTRRPVTARPYNPPQATSVCASQLTGFQAHPTDCNKFFQCNMGMAYLMTCPGQLVFNPTSRTCDYVTNVPGCP